MNEADEEQAKATSTGSRSHLNSPVLGCVLEANTQQALKAEVVTATEDAITIASAKGYRTARSTLFVNEGAWYFEVVVAHLGDSGHARVGWSTSKVELNAPVGFDEHGYGYCDVAGEKVHHRNRQSYGEAYAAGDVVGCYIYIKPVVTEGANGATSMDLDPRKEVDGTSIEDCNTRTIEDDGVGKPADNSNNSEEEEAAAMFRADGTNNYPCVEDANLLGEAAAVGTRQADEGASAPSAGIGGCVAFAKNGVFQGVAYHLPRRDDFSPTVSLFTLGKVEPLARIAFNFGPNFVRALPAFGDLPTPKPLSEASLTPALLIRQEDESGTAEGICTIEGNDIS
jgi:hypothetical protein